MERVLKLFAYGHLEREDLLAVSRRFHDRSGSNCCPSSFPKRR
jgi:hypothetical protein